MRISDLARLTRVSPRMLRHYDRIGLFRPVRVDDASGYREYSVEQVPLLNRIVALRDLGFSLERIAMMVEHGFEPSRLRDFLELRKAELETRIREERERLGAVEARLRQIEQEGHMPEYEVELKPLPAMLVASVRDRALEKQLPEGLRDIGPFYDALYAHLARHGIRRAAPQINLWHATPEGAELEAEVAQVIERPIPASDLVAVYELPEVSGAACLEYRGVHHYRPIEERLLALHAWIEKHGYVAAGPTRQMYLEMPDVAEGASCTLELQIPVAKA